MRYHAFACDYDGTLAAEGRVSPESVEALEGLKASGRKIVMVTGRVVEDLLQAFPRADMFDWIVAENGAVLYRPATREVRLLAEPPPEVFVESLRARGVDPLATGRVIVATLEPHRSAVVDAIHETGLELQVIFNKDAVMVLPSGVNKATGLSAALKELGLSPHNVVGVGDAENDHAFLSLCECAAAVASAVPMIKQRADIVTPGESGAGTLEIIRRIQKDDLGILNPELRRHDLLLGRRDDGKEIRVPPYGTNILLAGASGGGKSTFAASFMERLGESAYQFCIVDPEGDYDHFEGSVVFGDSRRIPSEEEVIRLLENPLENAVVNLLGVPLQDRPAFFDRLFSRLLELRIRTGRPHWIVIDEAHHLFPATWKSPPLLVPQDLQGVMMITVHPDKVSPVALSIVDSAIAIDASPEAALLPFAAAVGQSMPVVPPREVQPGDAFFWSRRTAISAWFKSIPPRAHRRRHHRKYAQGELDPDRSFYFRGPGGRLNLRAQNLRLFIQLAEGVDDDTWEYHLRRGDYSCWFRSSIKDDTLADEVAGWERDPGLESREVFRRIKETIEERYTAPA
jgi:HAD superfamily hydrolase (TIGR01484 family)